jgi:hypothetical protein
MKASHFGCVDTIVCHFPVKQLDFVAEKLLFVEISHLRFYEDMPELIRIFFMANFELHLATVEFNVTGALLFLFSKWQVPSFLAGQIATWEII